MDVRVFFMKTLINTELDFEFLTEQEQMELINKLIEDHNISYPNSRKMIMVIDENAEIDEAFDW